MKILNFGSCNIDKVHTVDHVCKAGETISSSNLEISPGGKGLNQSIALSRAGANVYHAGCIGKDGKFLKELLINNGVNVNYLNENESITGYAIIQVDKFGENCIIIYGGANHEITEEYIDRVLKNFNQGDFIILQNEISCLNYLINKAYERGLKIVLNPSPFNDNLINVDYNKISYLILNEIEAQIFSKKPTIKEFLLFIEKNYNDLHVVLTLGKNGCLYKYKNDYFTQPSFFTKVIDTTGAGDTFLGFFTAEILKGSSPKLAIKIASAAASIAISRKGAASAIPTRNEVLDIIDKLTVHKSDIETDEQLNVFKNLLKNNYSTLRFNDVANILGYSPSYLYKWILNKTGKSFKENLQEQRLNVAEELIRTTTLSISNIIEKVGYNNSSYFRKIFKNKFGSNPLALRKIYKE